MDRVVDGEDQVVADGRRRGRRGHRRGVQSEKEHIRRKRALPRHFSSGIVLRLRLRSFGPRFLLLLDERYAVISDSRLNGQSALKDQIVAILFN